MDTGYAPMITRRGLTGGFGLGRRARKRNTVDAARPRRLKPAAQACGSSARLRRAAELGTMIQTTCEDEWTEGIE